MIKTAYELVTIDIDKPPSLIPNVLPVGLTILAGLPKIGKSWIVLQMAKAISYGTDFLGQPVQKGKVLYMALEDADWQIQERMRLQRWQPDMTIKADFIFLDQFLTEFGAFHLGGVIRLESRIKQEQYDLVIIDTLTRAFSGIKDMNSSTEVTKALEPIHSLSNRNGMSTILVDHHAKSVGHNFDPNPINDIFGSMAKGGVTDTAMGFYREKGKPEFKLKIAGRRSAEVDYTLLRDRATMLYQNVLTPAGTPLQHTGHKKTILDILKQTGPKTFSDIAAIGGFPQGSLWSPLQDLVAFGEVSFDTTSRIYSI